MRFRKRHRAPESEGDMTPMIDMTFQLIAFFMVIINFTEADQNERIKLPLSQLAQPPDAPLEKPLTLQLTKEGTVLFAGEEVSVADVERYLIRERRVLETLDLTAADASVIIRAHQDAQTGLVQELIQSCQQVGFEKFFLRAKQEDEWGGS